MVRGGAEWEALFAECGVNARLTVNCSRQRLNFTRRSEFGPTFQRKVVSTVTFPKSALLLQISKGLRAELEEATGPGQEE